jgi:hypothetical protein
MEYVCFTCMNIIQFKRVQCRIDFVCRLVENVGSTTTGILLALISAMCVNLGKVCQKRGTQDLPLLVGTTKVLRAYFAHPWSVAPA